ncbi:MFS transporter [Lampropedia puyangensis]|uniref:MFS transporter n=1 Tax=Lampropedia puyangensis TaxID=1330072 RepID=A0A4S8EXM7_9BURK|nr:MFS transporter [Lampropedia puyangensis]THT99649.1 MFS transporter [Lampropedia puyangensis]
MSLPEHKSLGAFTTQETGIRQHTPDYWRASLALFCAGYATFSLLYCVQPLLPALARSFNVSAASSSLTLSLSTLALAFGLLPAGALAEVVSRKRMMLLALSIAGAAALLSAVVPHWSALLASRLVLGFALSGLPALAMAYVSEEFDKPTLPAAMGLYISGTVLGGMLGRTFSAILADVLGWRWAMGIMAGLALFALIVFVILLPPAKAFKPQSLNIRKLIGNFLSHLRTPELRSLFMMGFLLMGCFVAMFNYVSFRLEGPPFSLSSTVAGLLFLTYLGGIFSARLAAPLRARLGQMRALQCSVVTMLASLSLCALPSLYALTVGVGLFTFSFFAAHSLISAQVGSTAPSAKAQASSLYLCFYYLGSSTVGYVGGYLWQHGGWYSLLALLSALLALSLVLTRKQQP